jgi:transposase
MFHWYTSLLCESENSEVKQMDIVRAFNVSKISVKRAVKKYRKAGGNVKFFFKSRKGRGALVLTAEKIREIEEYMRTGKSISDISKIMLIKADTIKKSISAGKIKKKL